MMRVPVFVCPIMRMVRSVNLRPLLDVLGGMEPLVRAAERLRARESVLIGVSDAAKPVTAALVAVARELWHDDEEDSASNKPPEGGFTLVSAPRSGPMWSGATTCPSNTPPPG